MTSRPDTTGSGEARLPRPPGPPPDDPARPEPDARAEVPAQAEGGREGTADAGGDGAAGVAPVAGEAEPGDEPVEAAAETSTGASVEEPVLETDEAPRPAAGETSPETSAETSAETAVQSSADASADTSGEEPAEAVAEPSAQAAPGISAETPSETLTDQPAVQAAGEHADEDAHEAAHEPVREPAEPVTELGKEPGRELGKVDEDAPGVPASLLPREAQAAAAPSPAPRTAARGRLSHAMRPRATRAQLLAGLLCALLGFALVVQARQTQTQGLDQLRQADLVRLLDNVTNAEARAEQDVRNEQAIRDRLASGTDSSQAAQQAAQQRLDTLGLLAGTVAASGPGIELDITDPRRQVDASVLLDTLEELRDGGAEVIQIGDVRVVAATAFTDDADGVRVDGRLLTPPYRYKVIGEPQTLANALQIPGGVLDVLHSKGAQGKVTQSTTVHVDALRAATTPQYARPAPGGTP